MPTSFQSWDFVTTVEGWASSGPGICRWDGSDGDPAPGCLQSSALGSGGGFPSQPFVSGPNWSDWGVSSGFVQTVAVSLFVKYGGAIAFPEGDGVAAQIQTTSGTYTLFTTPDARTLTNWTGFSGTVTLPGTDGPGDFSTLRLLPTPNSSQVANTLIDHVQMTITFSSPAPTTISGRSSDLVSSHATLINAGVPVGGGHAIHARSAGVVAHAVLTAAQNACLEVYFAGVDNGDDFTIMAYSAPTELCLLNPVAGHEYILEAPAADLARFLGKRMGNVKFRRAGAGGNYTGAILLRAIELYYKVKT